MAFKHTVVGCYLSLSLCMMLCASCILCACDVSVCAVKCSVCLSFVCVTSDMSVMMCAPADSSFAENASKLV